MVMGVPRPKGNCLATTEGMPPPVSKYLLSFIYRASLRGRSFSLLYLGSAYGYANPVGSAPINLACWPAPMHD
jgi:hypothetical protein